MRSTIKIVAPKRRTNGNDGCGPIRRHSVFYFFPDFSGSYVPVCKTFYLRTLGMKSNAMVTEFVKFQTNNPLSSPVDKRGKGSTASAQEQNQAIIDHINSFNPQVSHYNLAHTPNRKYLDPDLSIRSLWENFNATPGRTKTSYSKYQKVFQSLNIGFGRPSQDECDVCEFFKAHAHSAEEEIDKCADCAMVQSHLKNAQMARKEYQKDKEAAAAAFSGGTSPRQHATLAADMQKVLMLPKTTLKSQYFVSRLTVFNETFSELNGEKDMCLLWHEGEAGRCATEVASAYWKVVHSMPECNSFTFWCDNCCAQNKNWTLFCALWLCVNKSGGPNSIELKYLEKGHTFMRPDSIHGAIGRKMKKTSNIYDWKQLTETIESAAKSIKVIGLTHLDMHTFKDWHVRNSKIPKLKDLKVIRMEKGSKKLFFKKSFEENFQFCDFLSNKVGSADDLLPQPRCNPRGINEEKKKKSAKCLYLLCRIHRPNFG